MSVQQALSMQCGEWTITIRHIDPQIQRVNGIKKANLLPRSGSIRSTTSDLQRERFDAELSVDDLKNKQREEIRSLLIAHSRASQKQANDALEDGREQVARIFGASHNGLTAAVAADGNGALDSLVSWLQDTLTVFFWFFLISHLRCFSGRLENGMLK